MGVGNVRGNKWWTLASVTLGLIMVGLEGTSIAIALPSISRDLHTSFSQLQWVTNAYLLVLAVSLVVAGKLGDRYGRRLVYMIGVVGFAATSVACGQIGSIGGLIAFRAIQGLFGALLVPNTIALLRASFPPEELNTAVGIWGGASAVSIAAGPILGGLLVQHLSWEWVFYINVPVGIIAFILGALVLNESRAEGGSGIDPLGVMALAVGLFGIIYGTIQAETWGWASGRTLAFLIGGAAVLCVFVLIESRVSAPLLPLGLFRSRGLSLSAAVLLLSFFGLFGTLFYFTLYLQNVHGFSPVQAGVRQLPLSALFIFSAPLGGLLNQRFGSRVAIPPAMVLVGAGMLSFIAIKPDSSYIHLWPGFAALGLGIGIVAVCTSDGIVAAAPVDAAGIAGGITSTAQQLGGVLAISLLGSILATRVGTSLFGQLGRAGVPASLSRSLANTEAFKQLVGQGVAPVIHRVPAITQVAIATGSHSAFVSGLHTVMIVAGCAAFVAAVLGLAISPQPQPAESTASLKPAPTTT